MLSLKFELLSLSSSRRVSVEFSLALRVRVCCLQLGTLLPACYPPTYIAHLQHVLPSAQHHRRNTHLRASDACSALTRQHRRPENLLLWPRTASATPRRMCSICCKMLRQTFEKATGTLQLQSICVVIITTWLRLPLRSMNCIRAFDFLSMPRTLRYRPLRTQEKSGRLATPSAFGWYPQMCSSVHELDFLNTLHALEHCLSRKQDKN